MGRVSEAHAGRAPGSPITVTGTGDTIVLTGAVKSAEDSKRLAGLAQARAKNVVNLLETPPPAELRQILLQVKFAAIDRVALSQIGFNSVQHEPKAVRVGEHAAVPGAAAQSIDAARRTPAGRP